MATTDEAYAGFDSVIGEEADSGGFVTLVPGEYPAVVGQVEKEMYSGSEKMPPCPRVIVHLTVDGGPQGMADVRHSLFMTKNQSWKIKELFVACGMVAKDAPSFAPDWTGIVGRECIAEIGNRTYNGNTYNDVKKVKAAAIAYAQQPQVAMPPAAVQATPQQFAYPQQV